MPPSQLFVNREQAGLQLARLLQNIDLEKDAVVLALPRGGVPVAFEIAKTFNLTLDVLVVRKLGYPHLPEYAIGAITEGGYWVLDEHLVGLSQSSTRQLSQIIDKEKNKVAEQIKKFRNNRPLPVLRNKTVVVVDDGVATGATARVAAKFLRAFHPKKIILAVPVCSSRADDLLKDFDEVFCLCRPDIFISVGQFFQDFSQIDDAEVKALLNDAKHAA